MPALEKFRNALNRMKALPEAIEHFPTYIYNKVSSTLELPVDLPVAAERRTEYWKLSSGYGALLASILLVAMPEGGGIVNTVVEACFVLAAAVHVIRILHWELENNPRARWFWGVGQLINLVVVVLVAEQKNLDRCKFPFFVTVAFAITRLLLWKCPGGIFYRPRRPRQQVPDPERGD